MSRCSSFPPPGYDKNGLTGDSLIHWYQKMRREAKKRYKRKRKLEKKRCYRCCGKRRGGERKKGEYLRRQDGEMEDSERSEITEQEEEEEVECGECSSDKKKGDEWLLLRDQIESWRPAKLQIWEQDCDDLEWLFGMKQSQKQRSKKVKACDSASFHGSSSLWHCARYLPDCDIYALPFTVLF